MATAETAKGRKEKKNRKMGTQQAALCQILLDSWHLILVWIGDNQTNFCKAIGKTTQFRNIDFVRSFGIIYYIASNT